MKKIFNFIFTIAHILLLILLILTSLNSWVSPKTFGYLNLLSLAFPVLLIINTFLILFWVIQWKKRALIFLFITFSLWKPITRWVNFSINDNKKSNLKIISFNAHNNQNLTKKEFKTKILGLDADIVFLQEHQYYEPSENYIEYPIIGLYTKHKILHHKKLTDNEQNGHAFYADIQINEKIIRVVNVYLEPFYLEKEMVKPTTDKEKNIQKTKQLIFRLVPTFKTHQEQILKIRKAIDESPYPIILAGDFNSVPNSWEYYQLGKNLVDAFTKVGSGSATSFHDYKFPIRIDYIFASPSIKPVSYKVHRDIKVSDHYPISAEFDL